MAARKWSHALPAIRRKGTCHEAVNPQQRGVRMSIAQISLPKGVGPHAEKLLDAITQASTAEEDARCDLQHQAFVAFGRGAGDEVIQVVSVSAQIVVFHRCSRRTLRCTQNLWERACSRRRRPSQYFCRLMHRFREQARSHNGICVQSRGFG